MKNILVIVDKYLPDPSSNGVCVSRIVDELRKNYGISVLTIYGKGEISINGVHVYSVDRTKVRISTSAKYLGLMQDSGLVQSLTEKALEIHNANNIDLVLSFYQPIEAIICGRRIAKILNIIHVPCFFDIPDTSIKTKNWKKKIIDFKFRRLYIKLSEKNSFIFLKHYRGYFNRMLPENNRRLKKPKEIGIPGLIAPGEQYEIKDRETIDLVYTGSFYSGIRNPEVLLDYFMPIVGTEIRLHLYSWECEDIIEKYRETYRDNLIVHGRINHDAVSDVISRADILVNLSNDCQYQVPAKVFEYFSACRPVINIIQRRDDAGKEEYERYPLSYNVMLYDKNEKNDELLVKEIRDMHMKSIPFDCVKNIFYDSTPEFFCEVLNGICEEEL